MTVKSPPSFAIPVNEEFFRRSLLLSTVFLLVAKITLSTDTVTDNDIGWHLMAGEWIIQHGHVPFTDPFSIEGEHKNWIAYSWLFEVILYGIHSLMGLSGFMFLVFALVTAIALSVMSVVRTVNPVLVVRIGLALVCLIAMAGTLKAPRPWLFSILFYGIELRILLHPGSRNGNKHLLWLPLLFIAWANIHIQFIYGLFVVFLFAVEPWVTRWIRLPWLAFTVTTPHEHHHYRWYLVLACTAATLITPYHYHLYEALFSILRQTGVYQTVSEMRAMDFRAFSNWVVLVITVLASFIIGMTRTCRPILFLLFVTGIFLAFRSLRDIWFLMIPAALILASVMSIETDGHPDRFTAGQIVACFIVASLFSMARISTDHLDEDGLARAISDQYPVDAVYFANIRNLPGPLYNDYNWGGFLIWKFPRLKVSIDGRANLHGDERIATNINTWNGKAHWEDNPELQRARLIIAGREEALCSLLKLHQGYELLYEDTISAVFARK